MLCPMKFMGNSGQLKNFQPHWECEKENCAWWMLGKNEKSCAIKEIAENIGRTYWAMPQQGKS